LIYPEIGMEPFIEKLAAMRLAPLQCALWGHPDTTGLPTIDVFFSAESMEPANAQTHYRERLQLLPNLGCSYPKPPAPAALSPQELGLPKDVPLIICAQSSFKWRAPFVDALARVLRETPTASLVYFENRDAIAAYAFKSFLHMRLLEHGVDATSRTIALGETIREAFLAVLKHCDIALDTFDFSGGNTTLDSLSVGLPVVTLPGEFMRARQSMAMLKRVGADELIAKNVGDYVKIATTLLADESRRSALRTAIIARVDTLFDDAAPIASLRAWILENTHQHK
jgi:predicted O-linked N-acetylglucosamine transferase (SPINDLY family)